MMRVILPSCISYNITSNLFPVYKVNLKKSFTMNTNNDIPPTEIL